MEVSEVDYWMEKIYRKRLSPSFYLSLVEQFVKTGEVVEIETTVQVDQQWKMYYDPVLHYLHDIMSDPIIQYRVLSSKIAGKIFYETIGRFVLESACIVNSSSIR